MDTASIDRKVQKYYDEELEDVKSKLKKLDGVDLDDLFEKSMYDINILKHDSLFYWNNNKYTQEEINSDYARSIVYRDIQGGYKIIVSMDLSSGGRVYDAIYRDLDIEITPFQIRKPSQQINPKFGKNQQFINTIGYLFYHIFLMLGLVFLFKYVVKHKGVSIAFTIAIVCWFVNHFVLQQFFEISYLGQFTNTNSSINMSLGGMVTNLVFLVFIISLIKKILYSRNTFGKAKFIIFPFIVTAGFINIIHLANGFLHSAVFADNYNSILQFQQDGVILISTLVIALAILFYGSLILFNDNPIETLRDGDSVQVDTAVTVGIGIWKYILWAIGVLLTYPLVKYLKIGIPPWTLYTFVMSYLLILELYIESKGRKIIFTFWWIIILSGFLASIIFYYSLDNSIKHQNNEVASLFTKSDKQYERKSLVIDSTLQESDVFVQLSTLPFPSGLDLQDFKSYITTILGDADQNVNIEIVANDREGSTLFSNHFNTSYKYGQALSNAKQVSEHLYFNPFKNVYYLNYFIENNTYTNSPFNLIIKLNYSSENTIKSYSNLNYVVFKNENVIINAINDITDISFKKLINLKASIVENDISFIVSNQDSNIKIVAFTKLGGLMKPISLFSFIVSISGLLLFLLALINTRYNFLPKELDYKIYDTSSLRVRIQLTIILLIVFSFLIIGIVTAYYFKNVLETNSVNTQREEVRSIISDIRASVEGAENNQLAAVAIQSRVDELSHVHNKKMVFFGANGNALRSSLVYPKISRIPYSILQNFETDIDGVGSTRAYLDNDDFAMDFIPVYYKNKSPYGYLGLTYKPINNSNTSIRNFISTILNVYIFLFLIAGALAIAIGNSITQPLSILSGKLKEFKFGKTNQRLEWNTKDEIGNLINEYNLLTQKLSESATMLARTERDLAWREMAKQVAHEIKNPLTPMKLSIQYLEHAVKSDPENSQRLIKRISATLIEQINNLNQIADEFSNFAKMPKATNEKIVINEVVEAIHDLFRKREDIKFTMSEPINDMYVFADRNHLVRILNNIVKNAIQAIPTDKKGIIEMAVYQENDMAIVSVKDNGTGISDQMKDKVFTPNFTTKSSGTGLGLAISANMIDSFNGRIYFETEYGSGTTFFIEVPLMRLQDNYPGQNRIALD